MRPSSHTTMLATLSVPCMCEMSKHSMRVGALGQVQRVLQRLLDGFRGWLQHAEAGVEAVFGVGLRPASSMAFFWPRCGVWISTLRWPRFSDEQFFERFAIFEFHGHVDFGGDELLIEIDLLEQRGEELAPRRTRPGLPRKTRGGPRSGRCAGGRG